MTSDELEFFAECEHRSACARLVTLHAPMYTDDFDWCMCRKCPYHGDRLGKNAKLRDENAKLRELVLDMWDTHVRSKKKPTAYGWVAIQEQAEELGIELVRSEA